MTTTTGAFKFFTRETLLKANKLAAARQYNRVLKNSFVKALPEDDMFPIIFEQLHEHKHGEACEPHIRCLFLYNKQGHEAQVDCDMDLFITLPTYDISAKGE